jgi:hypothetical protein
MGPGGSDNEMNAPADPGLHQKSIEQSINQPKLHTTQNKNKCADNNISF